MLHCIANCCHWISTCLHAHFRARSTRNGCRHSAMQATRDGPSVGMEPRRSGPLLLYNIRKYLVEKISNAALWNAWSLGDLNGCHALRAKCAKLFKRGLHKVVYRSRFYFWHVSKSGLEKTSYIKCFVVYVSYPPHSFPLRHFENVRKLRLVQALLLAQRDEMWASRPMASVD